MLFLAGMFVYTPGMLSRYSQLKERCHDKCSHPLFIEWETVVQGAYHDTLPQVPQCTPASSQPGYDLLKHIKNINDCRTVQKATKWDG